MFTEDNGARSVDFIARHTWVCVLTLPFAFVVDR